MPYFHSKNEKTLLSGVGVCRWRFWDCVFKESFLRQAAFHQLRLIQTQIRQASWNRSHIWIHCTPESPAACGSFTELWYYLSARGAGSAGGFVIRMWVDVDLWCKIIILRQGAWERFFEIDSFITFTLLILHTNLLEHLHLNLLWI